MFRGECTMLFAHNEHGIKIKASKHTFGWCPACGKSLTPKCGEIITHHWAHKTKCVVLWNTETEWHLKWKELAEKNGCEIEHNFGLRVADAIQNGEIYEFQHSSIQATELLERSEFYYNKKYVVNWIFDLSSKFIKGHILFKWTDYGKVIINTSWVQKTLPLLFKPKQTPFGEFPRAIYGLVCLDIGINKPLFNVRGLYNSGNGTGEFIPRDGIFRPFYIKYNKQELNSRYDLINGHPFSETVWW